MFVCAALILLALQPVMAAEFRVGIVPQYDVRELHAIWQPILDELSEQTGHQFTILATPTIPEFERKFKEGSFDFAYMNPYHAVVAHKEQGYIPVLRDVGKTLHGILVVPKESAIQTVEQLDGRLVAFPAPNALGASLLMRAELDRKFGVQVQPRYVKTHSSVYLNVVLGLTAAGGGVQRTLNHEDENVKGNLRVLFRTQEVPSHPWVVHPRVSSADQQLVTKALLQMAQQKEGAALLARVPIKQLGVTDVSEYESVAQMKLEQYSVQD